jgi:hypothetical protein
MGLGFGAGITGWSELDVRAIAAAAFGDLEIASIDNVPDVSHLDAGHVLPNMGNVLGRGVWYPRGFEDVAAGIP